MPPRSARVTNPAARGPVNAARKQARFSAPPIVSDKKRKSKKHDSDGEYSLPAKAAANKKRKRKTKDLSEDEVDRDSLPPDQDEGKVEQDSDEDSDHHDGERVDEEEEEVEEQVEDGGDARGGFPQSQESLEKDTALGQLFKKVEKQSKKNARRSVGEAYRTHPKVTEVKDRFNTLKEYLKLEAEGELGWDAMRTVIDEVLAEQTEAIGSASLAYESMASGIQSRLVRSFSLAQFELMIQTHHRSLRDQLNKQEQTDRQQVFAVVEEVKRFFDSWPLKLRTLLKDLGQAILHAKVQNTKNRKAVINAKNLIKHAKAWMRALS